LPGTDVSSSFVVAYLPRGGKIAVRLDKVTGKGVKARWFDPRSGRWREAGEYPSTGSREFVTPSAGERDDWVLILDDAARGYPTGRSS
jgi:hypothetical protein